ncbi:outer membrane protein assembly factor BamB family protein [Rubripirellula reticaptiva]|uniref:Outer membrane biogenesis protein BamB n=1 Tax=Rubripirellula reticaptiva TaxID=2528013 RepID=A0A5C6EGH3_9BACT|nr:PQQ-binding-like beta-propeller repeat protein [Rubripirellula reticaptiva]TWU48092.1 outer membrane biogenesis protein BamB [Rubripirellula reticaptiva]
MHRYVLASLCLVLLASQSHASDWPEFLGLGGAARSSDVVPTTWDETNNLAWKVDLPGSGSSSPIIVGDKVVVTCYVAGKDAGGNAAKRQVLCFDKNTGDQLWSIDFPIDYREDGYQGYITEHGYASNTPVTDGENVYVFLGKGGVHSISLDGKTNWSVDVGKGSSNRQWGSAASLVLFNNSVIVNAAEESKSIISLDKATGKEIWRQEADMIELTYGTPRIVKLDNGSEELVISVPGEIWSLNPVTGKLLWFAESPMTGNVSPSVIVDGETIYSFGGYRASGSIAVKAGGKDDVTDSQVVWTNRSSSYVATPLLVDGRFYWIDDRGIAYCTSAKDGEVVYRERVDNLQNGRPVYASPVLIGKHIYVVTRRSGTFVYEPTDTFKPLAQNVLAGDETDFNGSPAVSDGKLYIRSDQSLYCIGK